MVDLEKDLHDQHEAQIRARLEAAKAAGLTDLVEAEEKHLAAIGRLKKKEAAAQERVAAATSTTEAPAGRTTQTRSTTQAGASATKKG